MTPPSIRRRRAAEAAANAAEEERIEAAEQAAWDAERKLEEKRTKPITSEDIKEMQKDGRHAAVDFLHKDALTDKFWGMGAKSQEQLEEERAKREERANAKALERAKGNLPMARFTAGGGGTSSGANGERKKGNSFLGGLIEEAKKAQVLKEANEEAMKREVLGPLFPEKYGTVDQPLHPSEHVWKSDETALQDEFDQLSTQARHLGIADSPAFPKTASQFAGVKAESIDIEKDRLEGMVARREAARSISSRIPSGSSSLSGVTKAMGGKVFNDNRTSILGSPTNTWVAPNASMGAQAPFPSVAETKNEQAKYNLTSSGRPSRFFPTLKSQESEDRVKATAMEMLQSITGKDVDGKPFSLGRAPKLNRDRGDAAFLPPKPVPNIVKAMYGEDHLKPHASMIGEAFTSRFGPVGNGSRFGPIGSGRSSTNASNAQLATLSKLLTMNGVSAIPTSNPNSHSQTASPFHPSSQASSRSAKARADAEALAQKSKKRAHKAFLRRLVEDYPRQKAEHEARCVANGWGDVPMAPLDIKDEEWMDSEEEGDENGGQGGDGGGGGGGGRK